MSLQHILSTIDKKIQEEQKEILDKAKTQADEIIKEAKEEAVLLKQKIKADFKKKTAEKIAKASRNAQALVKNKIVKKKRAILDDVFDKAVKKLGKQNDSLDKLYQKLLSLLPNVRGEIRTNQTNLSQIKKMLDGSDIPVKPDLKEEGFIFISETIEIDNRLTRLVEEVRDETEIKVAKMLFS